jgi:hypothetical protein
MNYQRLNELQQEYLKCQSHEVWGKMYELCYEATGIALRSYLGKKKLRLSMEDREDAQEDCVLRLMERFKRIPGYKVQYWATTLRNEIRHRLHNKHGNVKKPIDSLITLMGFVDGYVDPRTENHVEPRVDYEDIDADKIVIDIATTHLPRKANTVEENHYKREFRQAILNVHVYTPKRLIYKYAPQLKAVFDQTRKYHG